MSVLIKYLNREWICFWHSFKLHLHVLINECIVALSEYSRIFILISNGNELCDALVANDSFVMLVIDIGDTDSTSKLSGFGF